jgi:hypothetical protein
MNLGLDLGTDLIACLLQVAGRLHTDPELRAGRAVAGQPERGVGRDRALAVIGVADRR